MLVELHESDRNTAINELFHPKDERIYAPTTRKVTPKKNLTFVINGRVSISLKYTIPHTVVKNMQV